MTHQVILIQSKPGLGKTTLAAHVVAALNAQAVVAEHFSMGDTLRGILSGALPSKFTKQVQKYAYQLGHHLPIPDGELTADIVGEFCERSAARGAMVSVIDGYPRYRHLLPGFERVIRQHGLHIALLVVLEGSNALAATRIENRGRTVLGRGESPPERLQNYAAVSAPVVEQLARTYPVLRINASNELEQKTAAVIAKILQ